MGAWIETFLVRLNAARCGVAPLVGAWIETYTFIIIYRVLMSHPSWVRGLKLHLTGGSAARKQSHPSWVRGLKLPIYARQRHVHGVAPLVGAWIETWVTGIFYLEGVSHPSWVRGLKHVKRC